VDPVLSQLNSKFHVLFLLLELCKRICANLSPIVTFHNILAFYDEFCGPSPNPKLVNHPLLAVCDCIKYIHSCPPYLEAVPSICTLRMCYTIVTRDPCNLVVLTRDDSSEGNCMGKHSCGGNYVNYS